MHLTENEDTEFNLKLEGTQLLKEGVYVFESETKRLDESIKEKYDTWTADSEWAGEQNWVVNKKLTNEAFRNSLTPELQAKVEGLTNAADLTKETYKELVPYLYFNNARYKNADGTFNSEAMVSESQNVISKFSGEATVDVGMAINMTFNVEEATVTTTRQWRSEKSSAPAEEEPMVLGAEEEPMVLGAEEEAPLIAATGDSNPMAGAFSGMFAALAGMFLLRKKKEQ